jgi:hypothetical protein
MTFGFAFYNAAGNPTFTSNDLGFTVLDIISAGANAPSSKSYPEYPQYNNINNVYVFAANKTLQITIGSVINGYYVSVDVDQGYPRVTWVDPYPDPDDRVLNGIYIYLLGR